MQLMLMNGGLMHIMGLHFAVLSWPSWPSITRRNRNRGTPTPFVTLRMLSSGVSRIIKIKWRCAGRGNFNERKRLN